MTHLLSTDKHVTRMVVPEILERLASTMLEMRQEVDILFIKVAKVLSSVKFKLSCSRKDNSIPNLARLNFYLS